MIGTRSDKKFSFTHIEKKRFFLLIPGHLDKIFPHCSLDDRCFKREDKGPASNLDEVSKQGKCQSSKKENNVKDVSPQI